MHRLIRIVVAVALVIGACGTDEVAETTTTIAATTSPIVVATTTTSTTTTSSSTTTTTLPAIDDLYVVVNAARLVYRCAGEGPVSVMIEQGWAGPASASQPETINYMGWESVVAAVAERARICVYNRRGVGDSDMRRETAAARTTQDQVDDLVGVISELGLQTPLILVGHSIAGFNIRLFSDQYPGWLAGAVFVDASHPDQLFRLAEPVPAAGPVEYLDFYASSRIVSGLGDMGDKPLVVLTGGRTYVAEDQRAIWIELHADNATLSTNSRHEVIADAGHFIQSEQPEVVVEAILWVIEQAGL